MKKVLFATILSLVSLPVYASSLPDADITQKIGIGSGLSASIDFKIDNRVSLGGSIGSPIYQGLFTYGRYDVRLLYKFLDQNKLSISGLVGVTGNPSLKWSDSNYYGYWVGGELGLALAYQFTSQLTGRLNLVGVMPFDKFGKYSGYWYGYSGPSSGIEIGYKINRNLELTLGANGQGDVLGLNFNF